MKPVLTYTLVFALSLSASVFIHYFSAGGSEDSDLNTGMNLAQEDIERIVNYEFDEKKKSAMSADSGSSMLFLGPLERDLADLQERQAELLKKLEGMMNGDSLADLKTEDITLPDGLRLREIVGDAMVRVEDQKQRDRVEAAAAARRERDAARRVELEKTLTDKLRLVGNQPAQVMAVLDQMDEKRNAFFETMREARESGDMANVDWNEMRSQFTSFQETLDSDVKGLLNPDQVTLYDDFKKESPWTFGGNTMRMGGGRRGGDAEGGTGGRRGGGNGGGDGGGRGGNR